MTSKMELKLAAKLAARYLARYERYEEECESYLRDGYRPHYCEHGTNQWVDWDNICGPCEDGHTMRDGMFRRQVALADAKERYAEANKLMEAVELFRRNGLDESVSMDAVWDRIGKLMLL